MRPTIIFSALALLLLAVLVVRGMNRPPAPAAVPQAAQQAAVTLVPTTPPVKQTIALAQNYRDADILYAIIDRPDAVRRKIYISPAGVDAFRSGQDFPDGTQIIVEAYDAARDSSGKLLTDSAGHLIAGAMQPEIHIAETRSTWQITDLASSARLGNFNFAAFDATTGGHTGEFIADCFSCHNQAAGVGFVFTRRELAAYANSGETQYSYCNQPARVPCRF